jgi:dipeptidyl aminopeptidase/acylaminoacyl peptidase
MKNLLIIFLTLTTSLATFGQQGMSPEMLWEIGRVSPTGLNEDGTMVVFSATFPSIVENSMQKRYYTVPVSGGEVTPVRSIDGLVRNDKISPDGSYKMFHQPAKTEAVLGTDIYPSLNQTSAYVYNDLDYRIWDTWNDGSYNHVFFRKITDTKSPEIDIMSGEPHNCPTKPFGGSDDYIWSPDSKSILYVCKKLKGSKAVQSTNTDIYEYHVETGKTTNLTEGMMGYDTHPAFSSSGALAWLSMARDGYESDKNDIWVMQNDVKINLTKNWDGTVNSFLWSNDGKGIYFNAPVDGTVQLFYVDYPGKTKKLPVVTQISEGQFDVNSIVAQVNDALIVTRSDMNHANEIFNYNIGQKTWIPLSKINDNTYKKITLSNIEKRMVKCTDGEEMLVWVIYPPDFDPEKKYPTLLYLQGGPQGALSQFYSFRWNFQLMAAQGYIVVAPNRRGMPGHGVEWNEQISKDWGGQAMNDYLSAIDDIAKEPYVDRERLGAVGASFGGYSAFFLAGKHDGRFKTFIAHDGVFNLQSMYGTTEELFFVNWDIGGPYWDEKNEAAQKSYRDFNPVNFVSEWDTPMLIIQGGKDFRVPIGQSLEAFQALQVQGIKSRLLFFPDENHWVLQPQNGIVWQREFFKWLDETL